MNTNHIKNAHLLSCLIGSKLAARLYNAFGIPTRAHWLRSARETGYSWF